MMQTKFIITMTTPSRPDLTYYFAGCKFGSNVFALTKPLAKKYDFREEADRDARFLAIGSKPDTFKVEAIRCRT